MLHGLRRSSWPRMRVDCSGSLPQSRESWSRHWRNRCFKCVAREQTPGEDFTQSLAAIDEEEEEEDVWESG